LEEASIDKEENLDILSYWKANQYRYPELAFMARDILSIPVSTVASEPLSVLVVESLISIVVLLNLK